MVIDNGVVIGIAIENLKVYIAVSSQRARSLFSLYVLLQDMQPKSMQFVFLILSSARYVLTILFALQGQSLKSLMNLVTCIHIPSVTWISYLSLSHFPRGFPKFLNGGFRWEIINKPLNERTNVRLVPRPSFWLS